MTAITAWLVQTTRIFNWSRKKQNKFKKRSLRIPPRQQTIIKMKDIEGYEVDEIAKITASQPEAVRVNLSRARKKVREEYIRFTN